MTHVPISQRKKRLPKPRVHTEAVTLPKAEELLAPHEQRKKELFDLHEGKIPLKDIFVDRLNGVELFRNPKTGGWVYKPESREL